MFTDLSHHRTCRSAYGGSYFGYHSRYEPIKVQYPAFLRLTFFIATFNTGLSAIRQYPLRVLPHSHTLYFSIPHLMRFTALVFGFFHAFHIHMRILRLNHSSVSRRKRLILVLLVVRHDNLFLAKAVASPGELTLIDRWQDLVNALLHQTVYHGGDS